MRVPLHGPAYSKAAGILAVVLTATMITGCDSLINPPATPGPETMVSFSLEGTTDDGILRAFRKATQAYLLFTRPDSVQRDTLLRIFPHDGLARVRLVLDTRERVNALGVYGQLRAGSHPLFESFRVIRVELGKPTSVQMPVSPIPAHLVADRVQFVMTVGDTVHLSSAVLFATGDTIPGLAGVWSSGNAQIVAVTPGGISLGRGAGEAFLHVGYGELRDSVGVRVLANR